MEKFVQSIKGAFDNFGFAEVLMLILLISLFFIFVYFLIRNNSWLLLIIFAFYTISLSLIAILRDLEAWGLVISLCLFVIFIAVLYAKEIKRDLWAVSMSSSELKSFKDNKNSSLKSATECIENIVSAVQNMSKNNVGALIILADNNMPTSVLESGVLLNSEISSEMIESVFFPKTPLHDGAMIIKSKEIKYAGCFLPLSQKLNIPKDLGTRHRAGIGITETINVTSIIVSEETGIISIAKGGKITRYADSEMLKETLNAYYKLELIAEK